MTTNPRIQALQSLLTWRKMCFGTRSALVMVAYVLDKDILPRSFGSIIRILGKHADPCFLTKSYPRCAMPARGREMMVPLRRVFTLLALLQLSFCSWECDWFPLDSVGRSSRLWALMDIYKAVHYSSTTGFPSSSKSPIWWLTCLQEVCTGEDF